MRKSWLVLVWLLVLSVSGCGDELSGDHKLLSFFLETANNPGLVADAQGTIGTETVSVVVPEGTDLTALVPTFSTDGTKVVASGVEQRSGQTAVDFTNPVTFRVIAANLSSQDYVVTITTVPRTTKEISSFSFFDANNPNLTADVAATINGNAIAATVPFGTDVTALVATFVHNGASVTVGGIDQMNSVTANNFTAPVTYTVTAGDGSTRAYVVTVTIAPSPAKDLTAFSFLDADNAALALDVTATINGTAIAATVPFGTNLTALVASFSTTGQAVRVGTTVQVSGTTPNDFTAAVTYVVTAADASTKTYTVTVTIAPGDQKDITAFSFLSSLNGTLPADATATINGTAIAVTVPTGTNVTALIATFTHTGASVTVGGTPQVSGVTANNFTSPVSYLVNAADTTTQTYIVTVTVAPPTSKDVTAFSFLDGPNGALSADVTATIAGNAITATVPFGTSVTSLIATFTHTGSTIAVGLIPQTSGITSNDFTSPVTYVVTAGDNSTKLYTVTVVIAANAAKDITAFSFLDTTNPALSADITATITGTVISATVPFGTDVTALVATFTHTGASVAVGATTQSSGITPNNFTSSVNYVVTASDSSMQIYTVTVTIAPNTAKDITAFSFLDASNPALSVNVTGTIVGTTITLNVPPGTDLTALVATFTTTGASVAIGATPQMSGITANDFTASVTYVVTAGDTTTKTYTVIVDTIRRFAVPLLRATAPLAAQTINTVVRIVYGRMTAPDTAHVDVRIFATNGTVFMGANGAVCNPCSADLTSATRGLTIDLGSRAANAGVTSAVDAYAIIDVTGDSAAVAVGGVMTSEVMFFFNAVADLVTVVEPPVTVTQKLLFGPATEAPGAPTTAGNHDTRITILNSAGSAAQSATVALRLYGTDGALLQGAVAPICNPCNFVVDSTTPRLDVTIDALRTAAGVTTGTQTFLGTFDVSGSGAGQVAVVVEKELGTTTTPTVISRSQVPVHTERPAAITTLRFVTPGFQLQAGNSDTLEIESFSGLGTASPPTATVAHFVFDDATGALMTGNNGQPVCNGCGGTIGAGFQSEVSSIPLMAAPQPVSAPKSGYVVTTITGGAAAGIFASTTARSTTPGVESTQQTGAKTTGATVKTFVIPHTLETTGRISNTQNTFDTTFHMTYTAGLPGTPVGAGANVDLYLFDDGGAPMTNNAMMVCNPCSFALAPTSPATRKQTISMDDLITATGTFNTVKVGFGVVVVSGNADNVNISSFITNSHTSAFDVSVFGFAPVEVQTP